MRVNKGLLSVIAVATVASLGGLTTTATAATKKVTTTYSSQSHALIIRGQTSRHAKLVLNYQGKPVATSTVKAGKFTITQPFQGYGTFKLVDGSQVLATIPAKRYAAPRVIVISAEQTAKGIHYTVANASHTTLTITQNGRYLKTIKATRPRTNLFLSNAQLKHGSHGLRITQRVPNKKTSPAVKLPVLKANIKQVTNF
ncbi:hypothetical protein [Lactiplantibacillus paraplantarum]|uniref:Extracellular zinc metalloproteinase n=1 Tax=Lactiplantibacillus paraplantarum TaxID=60520 RepID=A0ABQ0NA86_9LACO|nr:hypothetical protein [Lactiplantibacillus paraplantarum]ERL45693.1 extracellular zinc metalloproteinase [Lactiplantibacillus paraplantarum]KRL50698.1 extracellular zinc metalloproteinase [Lactiplantibacillus paraplantarum DSM 10667]MCU4684737.1 hypothetical protein [Lactiplantibacillus paraplantarum]MDL2062088.1 hypothetical protein [Lactiplantibacillus paraplantarum]QJU51299.1 hypothetical protein CK401_02204 [Lactiplantibacillus paraplantarum]